MKLNAKQLRKTKPNADGGEYIIHNALYLVLDNVLDTYNIGSLFRLADAAAVKEIILCGDTETPPSSRIHKAAVGTEEWVKWRYFSTALEAVTQLKKEWPGGIVVAIEQDPRAKMYVDMHIMLDDDLPAIVVVGHETNGVSKDVLDVADMIVEIPMFGVNKSLNVHVAASIVLYKLISFV
ncbi:MAG: TrmH family RNA methyltransferase [Candidatus Amesbacteria bacterium]|nr:TrmH family RNA methyltransferase [Candidatus Amesbacteria bacterium]